MKKIPLRSEWNHFRFLCSNTYTWMRRGLETGWNRWGEFSMPFNSTIVNTYPRVTITISNGRAMCSAANEKEKSLNWFDLTVLVQLIFLQIARWLECVESQTKTVNRFWFMRNCSLFLDPMLNDTSKPLIKASSALVTLARSYVIVFLILLMII